MAKTDEYREALTEETNWDTYLLSHSGLPGPRGNIELGTVAGELASRDQIRRWLEWDAQRAPTNTPEEFLAFCGVLGLGRLVAAGDHGVLAEIRTWASDPRWRVREGVAMALQSVGDADFEHLLTEMRAWASGTRLEQRAAAAALCEPRLLLPGRVGDVLDVLDDITSSIPARDDRHSDDFKALRKGLGYCWSVAVAADPMLGKPEMERWTGNDDPDIRWIMRENLRKKRLVRMDPEWVAHQLDVVAARVPSTE
jgi:hypothetical protein